MNEQTSGELQSYTLNRAFFQYGVKKTERLVRALYLITNFFPDSEPLKWRLRRENLTLLEEFSRHTGSSEEPASIDLALLENTLLSVLALLGVAYTAGLISEMNYSIVRHEYESLLRSLRHEVDKDKKHTPLYFPKDFFKVSTQQDASERLLFSTSYGKQEISEMSRQTPSSTEGQTREQSARTEKPKQRTSSHTQEKSVTDTSKRTQDKKTHHNRRDTVITLIKDKKEVSIKDIAREIQGVSEKTIQRELNKLVTDNIVEKIGKKRWSRYRLRA